MKKIMLKEVSARAAAMILAIPMMTLAFIFACGFGDETGVLRWSPSSKACSQDVNFTGAVTVAGEQLVGTTGSASITTLGTITTGVWHGTAIATTYGGTGNTTGTAASVTVVDGTDTSSYVAIFDSATGALAAKTDAGLTYNAGTGMLTATGFTGPLTGAASANPTITSGATAPSSTPGKIGDIYIDTVAHKLYFADAAVDSGSWVVAN